MRVVMFVANAFAHDARVTREARTLAKAGHEVTVLAVRRDRDQPEVEQLDGFTVERIESTGRWYSKARSAAGVAQPGKRSHLRAYAVKFARIFNDAMFCVRASKRAAEFADVYHCMDLDSLLAGWLAMRRRPGRLVYESHELYAHLNVESPNPLRGPAVHTFERSLIRDVDAVITVSESFAKHLASDYGVKQAAIVRNIPDTSLSPEHIEIPDVFRIDAPKILYVGGVQANRGIEQTTRAIKMLDGVHLIIMGPAFPADEARVRDLISSLGVSDRVHVLPPVPFEVVSAVAAYADIGMVPFQNTCLSHYLTIPNKLFECLHAGLPIVASDFPEFRAIVDRYDCGTVCDASDPGAIAAAIKEVLADRERFAANARAAAKELTWEREEQNLLEVYEQFR